VKELNNRAEFPVSNKQVLDQIIQNSIQERVKQETNVQPQLGEVEVLPDLVLDSGLRPKADNVLSVLLRPESPPPLGLPMRLWARTDVPFAGGNFDVGLIVILE